MERTVFTNLAEPWWLLMEEGLDYRLDQAREQLGINFGWDRTWFTQQNYVDQLFESLVANNDRLLEDLDYAEDVEMQVRWLDELVEKTKPKIPAKAQDGRVESAVNEVMTMLSSDAANEMARHLDVNREDIEALTDDARFKEILKEVLESRLSSASS